MRHWLICLVTVAAGGLVPAAADACWPAPPVIPPPVRIEHRTITKYRTELRTEFKEVQRTVCRRVPETEMREVMNQPREVIERVKKLSE